MSHSVSVIENKPTEKTFVFEGDFSIQCIETTKDEIQNNSSNAALIVLDFNNLTNIDISFLQLMYSVILHCEKNKISLQIASSNMSDDCKAIMKKSGFEKIICK